MKKNTIETYISSLFINIEVTDEIRTIKEDLLNSSFDKYEDLIKQGYNENEAIGKVISEFGSLDEIISDTKGDNILVDVKHNTTKKFIEKAIPVMFLIITVIYLIFGFTKGLWGKLWIMYPIAGIVAGILNIIFINDKK